MLQKPDTGELLFLAHRIPYPPNKGDKIRSWNILKYLAQRRTVHIGCFIDDPDDEPHVTKLREVCAEVHVERLQGGSRVTRMLGGLRRGEPLSVALCRSPQLAAWVRDLLVRRPVTSIFAFSSQMAQFVRPYTASHHVAMDFVDMDSEKWARYAALARGPKRWVYAREAKLLREVEAATAAAADVSYLVSEDEARLFARKIGSRAHNVQAVMNGVDYDYFDPAAARPQPGISGAPVYVFTGAMDYAANIDAVLWFVRHVWPNIRRSQSQAAFLVVGSSPPSEIRRLHGRDGIIVTGRVPEARAFIAAADIVVAPLRVAQGIQNKVLEAMAMAKPVLATPEATTGIGGTVGLHYLVDDMPDGFALQAADLAANAALRQNMGEAARRFVTEHFDWQRNLGGLDAWLEAGAARRRVR